MEQFNANSMRVNQTHFDRARSRCRRIVEELAKEFIKLLGAA